jgi:hypothetical protein
MVTPSSLKAGLLFGHLCKPIAPIVDRVAYHPRDLALVSRYLPIETIESSQVAMPLELPRFRSPDHELLNSGQPIWFANPRPVLWIMHSRS